ncbi:MAG: RluA family pseudouridine synthase [Rubricella sp.]
MTETITLTLSGPGRLDKLLAEAVPEGTALSRSRLRALVEEGAVTGPDGPLTSPALKVPAALTVTIAIPEPDDPEPQAEDIPLSVVFEDDDLIVVDKPAGMVVHPAPGAERGTLVNALLHHCGDSLSGIGGQRRPGIVHRIDKDTSGLLVVAKSDRAHQGLAALFAAHDIEREYRAVCRGVPDRGDPRLAGLPAINFEADGTVVIRARIDRSRADRKKMAVVREGGRHAVTRMQVLERFGTRAALLSCRLETGRTHQIRVHAAHIGHPLLGDPVYGGSAPGLPGFPRQALHAARLGFRHPTTGEDLNFLSRDPADFDGLLRELREISRERD